jgi:two-component system NtrC family sensor kinase
MKTPDRNCRILLVDDKPAIHEDFRRLLMAPEDGARTLDNEAAALFGLAVVAPADVKSDRFELDSAMQGQEALIRVQQACAGGRPYALAFVDMRMPPGWDGLTTILKLWDVDPSLQVVICTAYSDRSWAEVQAALPVRSRWLVLKKPFYKVELLQIAHVLVDKWHLEREQALVR